MTASLDHEMQQRLRAYLAGELTLQQITDWFWPASWPADRESDPSLSSVVGEIQLRLSEFDNGHWTEHELRDLLQRIADSKRLEHAR